ncbi:hypothetical protein KGF56_004628 [Candida oxycetoniae]|uniref:Protein kinase domain-containing protein n=1 Tax=Candida oxycetoniae TaxID=497107 RepID=A0AAI9SSX3_9ASCO|nr:uncharacterized protein KGF56_004628 [Candida oxycetoniae]KAI3402536.2 hypothetical protein KGF56_004628 [Candida oxycetoniae]
MDCTKLEIEIDPKTRKKIINGRYRIIKKIGRGQYGKVLLGEVVNYEKGTINGTTFKASPLNSSPCNNSSFVAIKTINRIDKAKLITKSYISNVSKIKKEIEILKQCNHPNIVKLYTVIDDLKFDKILLVLEYCKYGEVDWKHYNHYYEKYSKHKLRQPLNLNKILREILNGLEYLHDYKHIIHRDLKPSNLLIDENNIIKISDFGVSLLLENNVNDSKELAKIMGTPAFYAPELCQFVRNRMSIITNKNHSVNQIKIDYRIDIWSLGVTMYCLMFNTLPFTGINEFDICKNIVETELKFPRINHTSRVTEEDIEELAQFKQLVKLMLKKDPNERITLHQIKNHPFTTFDLTQLEREKFFNFNKAVFKNADCKDELQKTENTVSLPSRIRKFFTKSSLETTVKPQLPKSPPSATSNVHLIVSKDYNDLEHVDDLLDSYLDDSSSLGSLESEEDDDEPPTINLFSDFSNNNNDSSSSSNNNNNNNNNNTKQPKPKHLPQPLNLSSITNNKTATKDNLPFRPPIQKSSASYSKALSPTVVTPSNSVQSLTPVNEFFTVIGESSPSTNIAQSGTVFSPSRRFFEAQQSKNSKVAEQPTIKSLASTNKHESSKGSDALDLMEPPSLFIGGTTTNKEKPSNNYISERKGSFDYGLSRITSSSSSLNLNAYLTDDSESISIRSNHIISKHAIEIKTIPGIAVSTAENEINQNDSSSDEEANSTFVLAETSFGHKYKDLSQYLDSLP